MRGLIPHQKKLEVKNMNPLEMANKISKEESIGILMAISIVSKRLAESLLQEAEAKKEADKYARTT